MRARESYDLVSIPHDNAIEMSSPIDVINSNLQPFEKYIRIGHVNSVSLPKYRDEISRVAISTKMDILGASETYVKNHTPKDLYQIQGYKFFHLNRDRKNSGGVGIFVKDIYKAKKIEVNYKAKQPEIFFVEVEINKIKILTGVIYKSPKERYGVFGEITEILAYFSTRYQHAIFLGDFNINQLEVNSRAFKFFHENIINPLSLSQMVKSPTRVTTKTSTLIDLILVNSPKNVKYTGNTCISGNLDHAMVYCAYSVCKQKFKPKIIRRRDFRNFAADKFKLDMQNAPFNSINVSDENK